MLNPLFHRMLAIQQLCARRGLEKVPQTAYHFIITCTEHTWEASVFMLSKNTMEIM